MEFLANPVVAIVLLIGVLVFVHEAGHFVVGKLCGIPVEIFSIGFGPIIFGFQKGETHYRLSIIPLGGFVKFYGSLPSEEVPDSLKGREFFRSPLRSRALTIAAGPVSNLVLAVLVFAAMVMHGIKQAPSTIGEIIPSSPAERAGLEFGDRVLAINGEEVFSWKDLQRMISEAPGQALLFKIQRGEQVLEKQVSPDTVKDSDLPGNKGRIGISPNTVPTVFTLAGPAGSGSGFLAAAGVKTGDRAVSVRWNSEALQVSHWQQWIRFLKRLSQTAGARQFELDVYAYNPEKDEDKQDAPHRTLTVTVPENWSFDPETLGSSTGALPSQLTLFKVAEGGDSAAFQAGDLIESWNGKPVTSLFQLSEISSDYRQPSAELGILRNGEHLNVTAQLKSVEAQKLEGKVTLYVLPVVFWGGFVSPEPVEEKFTNPLKALGYGLRETYEMMGNIGSALAGLFTGEMPLATLGGPIAIAKAASDSVRIGWQAYLTALAVISINLALINLVPIPILDGGQIVLLGIEAFLRRPVPERVIENYQKIGFVMVLALIVVATYNDLGRFWASMMRGMGSMF